LVVSHEIRLRGASREDDRLLWYLRNEPEAIEASFSGGPIGWREHKMWFKERLLAPNCRIYIVENAEGKAIGQVRFDTRGDTAWCSIVIAHGWRGKGYGTKSIAAAARLLLAEAETVQQIVALIKPGNEASIQAFSHAGFRDAGPWTEQGQEAIRMVFVRPQGNP
jgi:RimJ/RimL family protein N-acetyltransferase